MSDTLEDLQRRTQALSEKHLMSRALNDVLLKRWVVREVDGEVVDSFDDLWEARHLAADLDRDAIVSENRAWK